MKIPTDPARIRPQIEALEARIAPATIVSAFSATYTDADGDAVTIKSSKAIFDINESVSDNGLTFSSSGSGQHLDLWTLGTSAKNAVLSIVSVAKTDTTTGLFGDGLVHVGTIDASGDATVGFEIPGIDLVSVTVDGDLGQINCGDNIYTTPALKSLTVSSLGFFGASFQSPGQLATDVESNFSGSLGTVKIAHDMKTASLVAKATGAKVNIGSVTIGGSLIGSSAEDSGKIQADGNIGAVRIGGSIVGSSGQDSGSIDAGVNLAAVTIGGSLRGNLGEGSGRIKSGGTMAAVKIGGSIEGSDGKNSGLIDSGATLGAVTIGGSVNGGEGSGSGQIEATGNIAAVKLGGNLKGGTSADTGLISSSDGNIASVTIGGSLIGTKHNHTGSIDADKVLGPVKILGDLIGGNLSDVGSIDRTGYIQGQRITSVTINGSIYAGTNSSLDISSPLLTNSGAIHASDGIGSVVVLGSLVGNATTSVVISAKGLELPTPTKVTSNIAIKSVVVNGNAEYAFIGAGYDGDGFAANPDAQISSVTVKHDWIASTLAAGITNENGIWGDGDDTNQVFSRGSLSGNETNLTVGDTVTIGSTVYTFQTTALTNGDVLIGADKDATLLNLIHAINKSGGVSGTDYVVSVANPDVRADLAIHDHGFRIRALAFGVDANLLATDSNTTGLGSLDFDSKTLSNVYSDHAQITAKIAKVVVGGQVLGTDPNISTQTANDSFAFISQIIGSFKLGNVSLGLQTGVQDSRTFSFGTSQDVFLKEI